MIDKEKVKKTIKQLLDDNPNNVLKVAPVINVRCLIPCRLGTCVCYPSFDDKYCIVNEEGFKKSQQMFQDSLDYFQEKLDKIKDEFIKEEFFDKEPNANTN